MYLLIISLCVISLAVSTLQEENDCGIVGGDPADIKEVPYQLSLRKANRHICGASIISDSWAVSAAHCHSPNTRYTLVAGASLLNQGGSVHPVAKFILHPSYSSSKFNNDIAVLQVQTPFPLGSSGVNRIALATQAPPVGAVALASGWGHLKHGGPDVPNQLQKVLVPIVSNEDCKKAYSQMISVSEEMICAGYEEGGKSVCQGDSGGPLVVDNKLIGVVSWGKGCAEPGYPGVYARVDKLNQWVKEVSENSHW